MCDCGDEASCLYENQKAGLNKQSARMRLLVANSMEPGGVWPLDTQAHPRYKYVDYVEPR